VHVDIFLEPCDVTFFENIFPMKKSYDMSSLPANVIADTTPKPSKKNLIMLNIHLNQSMRRLILTLIKPLLRHLHLLM
jgi:hypothetical protein